MKKNDAILGFGSRTRKEPASRHCTKDTDNWRTRDMHVHERSFNSRFEWLVHKSIYEEDHDDEEEQEDEENEDEEDEEEEEEDHEKTFTIIS
ncbi:hypothetical protein HZH66_014496 [Vespula vulgaris]|uniref:Uncharacterized protein n=1 Tax=Vespula vulgaris TaxID=7454 RepID=A0A834J2W4_VESVU|nr:hypothetical protein HZH66_014496 [Vespula vulgaris]